MVQRSARGDRPRPDGVGSWPWVGLLPWALTGCPLTDTYFVDANAGVAGMAPSQGGSGPVAGTTGMAEGGAAGMGALGGAMPSGGNGGAGTGGSAAGTGLGGDAAVTGGTAGTGDTGGVGGTSHAGDGGGPGAGGMAGDGSTCVDEPEVCDGESNDCDDEIDEDGACPSDCVAQKHDDHLYVLCMSTTAQGASNFEQAHARCAGLGTELGLALAFDLASLESDEENTFLKEWSSATAPVDGAVWIGANDEVTENTWVWGRGTNAVQFFRGDANGGGTPYMGRYNDFAEGRPNSSNATDEDCGAFDSEVAWQWNDRECSKLLPGFACEEQL